ncbi:hypothetical protein AR687_19755 [Flavobacteriaceae bacterium CRH]|nr:hypothetical protein AR687_19755 [Flavobacteriaceae bacterium CRH]
MRKNTFYISILKIGTMKKLYFFSLFRFLGSKVQSHKGSEVLKLMISSFFFEPLSLKKNLLIFSLLKF